MRVLINAASANTGGAVTYLRNVLAQLPVVAPEADFDVIAPSATLDVLAGVLASSTYSSLPYRSPPRRSLQRIVFDQVRVPRLARRLNADVLFSSNGFGTLRSPCRQLLLVRNSLYFCPIYEAKMRQIGRSLRTTRLRRKWSIASMRAADLVLFPTQAMRDLVLSYDAVDERKTACLHYGFDRETFFGGDAPQPGAAARVRGWKDSGCRILLTVGTYAVHKNLETVVRALPALLGGGHDVKLVMTTSRESTGDKDEYDRLMEDVRGLGLTDAAVAVGPVPYDQLHHLYALADVFVFPSFTESFGQTMVEAMACGLPITAAGEPVNREVLGDAASYFGTFDAASCARETETLLVDPARRDELSARSRRRSERFCWKTYAGALVAILEQLAGSQRA